MYILKYIRHLSLIYRLKNEWCLLVIVHVEDFEGGIILCVGKRCVAFTVLSILSCAEMKILVILYVSGGFQFHAVAYLHRTAFLLISM